MMPVDTYIKSAFPFKFNYAWKEEKPFLSQRKVFNIREEDTIIRSNTDHGFYCKIDYDSKLRAIKRLRARYDKALDLFDKLKEKDKVYYNFYEKLSVFENKILSMEKEISMPIVQKDPITPL